MFKDNEKKKQRQWAEDGTLRDSTFRMTDEVTNSQSQPVLMTLNQKPRTGSVAQTGVVFLKGLIDSCQHVDVSVSWRRKNRTPSLLS